MKRETIPIIVVLAMLAMSGCLVSSLHPFYKAKDKFYDPVMTGNWIDGDSCIWTIRPNERSEYFMGPVIPDSTCRITYYEEEDRKAVFTGTLFRLNGVSYVDFYPAKDEEHFTTDMTSFHFIPVHTLARVQYNSDSILIYWYGEDWLNDLFEQNRIRIEHETVNAPDYDRHVLTASTDELQKFIRKYAGDPMTIEKQEDYARGDSDDSAYVIFLKLKPYDGEIPE
jgi:hypothetical protein